MPRESDRRPVVQNRRARHDYRFLDVYEAGLVLTGTEVKSLRMGRASLREGFALVRDGEAWLYNVHIPQYTQGTWTNHEPRRTRKLLLHRREIARLIGKTQEKGLTLVPVSLYFSGGKAKVEIALAQGKQKQDKRHDIAEREAKLEMARAARRRR